MRSDFRPVAIGFAGFAAFLNLYAPQAVLPMLGAEFGAGPAEIGMAMTATTLAIALVAPFVGALADIIGRKRVIVTAMLAIVIPTAAIALAPNLEMVLAARFIQGLVLPPIFAVTVTYIGEEWPPLDATTMTGIYMSASSVGGFLGRFATGIIADWIGWREAFLFNAALALICAGGVALLLWPERRFVRATNLNAAFSQMLKHLRNPALVGTFAIGFGVLFSFIAAFTYINFLLAAPPFNLTAAFLGSIFIVYLTGSVLTPWTGRLVRRFGRRRLVLGLIALWACGLVLTLASSLPVIILGLTLFASTGFLCQACSTSYVAITAKDGPSTAVGLYVTCYYIGGSAGAALGGLAWNIGGWDAVVALIAVVLVAIALIVASVWERDAKV
jgi:predicted MFS family arabinose efflux permease